MACSLEVQKAEKQSPCFASEAFPAPRSAEVRSGSGAGAGGRASGPAKAELWSWDAGQRTSTSVTELAEPASFCCEGAELAA